MFGQRQSLVQTLPGLVPLLHVEVTHPQVVEDLPVGTLAPVLRLLVRLDSWIEQIRLVWPLTDKIQTKFVSSEKEQRPRHLFDVVRTVGVENVANLKLFQRFLNLSFLSQYQSWTCHLYHQRILSHYSRLSTLDIVRVFTHWMRFLQLFLDDGFAFL